MIVTNEMLFCELNPACGAPLTQVVVAIVAPERVMEQFELLPPVAAVPPRAAMANAARIEGMMKEIAQKHLKK